MTVAALEQTRTLIRLEAACDYESCAELAFRIRNQLDVPNYTEGMSIMACPDSIGDWRAEHRTARKRAWRAERLGYTFDVIDRSQFNDDIHDINTSLDQRQGRPMTAGYVQRHNHGALPDYPCDRHRIHTYGVLQDDRLRAYLTLYRVGDLAMVSMILGHGDHLENNIMYLLIAGTIERHVDDGCVWFYNRHDSGTDGLRFFKERVGFTETDIAWEL